MCKSLFSEPQIVHILGQADLGEKTIGQLCRDHGISVNTFCPWRCRYGGIGIPELLRQRRLEQENA
jgi:putative transposase